MVRYTRICDYNFLSLDYSEKKAYRTLIFLQEMFIRLKFNWLKFGKILLQEIFYINYLAWGVTFFWPTRYIFYTVVSANYDLRASKQIS